MIRKCIIIVLTLTGFIVKAQDQRFGLREYPGAIVPNNITLYNEDSVEVYLENLLDKPTLLCFVYYECSALCPKMMEGVAELVNYSDALPGKDYQVFVVSIDHTESSILAREQKRKYTTLVQKNITPYFWRFFTADSINIQALTSAVGWEFRRTEDDFIHTTSSVLLTPGGMVSQYFFGTYFNYMHFDMSLDIAKREEISPTRLKILKYCTNIPAEKNKRIRLIFIFFGIAALVIILSLFSGLILMDRRKQSKVQNF